MGLDMYMYQIDKLTDIEVLEVANKHTRDIPQQYNYINKETFDGDPEMFSDLIPFIRQVTVIDTLFDRKKCFAEHGVPEDAVLRGSFHGPDGVGWVFDNGHRLDLTQEELAAYLYDASVDFYVFKCKEVYYWRKFYDLDTFIADTRIAVRTKQMLKEGRTPTQEDIACWQTENCGYYMLSSEEKRAVKMFLLEHDEEDFDELDDERANLFYHAWW